MEYLVEAGIVAKVLVVSLWLFSTDALEEFFQ
jgi:hypothetical protein